MGRIGREAVGRLGLLLLGCGTGLALCELTVRELRLEPRQGLFQRGEDGEPAAFQPLLADRDLGWRWQPGTVQIRYSPEFRSEVAINAEGFRSAREFRTGRPGAGVVAVLGDSITEAAQVAEASTFVGLLEAALKAQPPAGAGIVQVQNYGVSGFGFPHHLQAYRHRARQHAPEIVLVCAFLFNDVWDSGLTDLAPLRPRFLLGPGGEIAGLGPFEASGLGPPSRLERWLSASASGRLVLGLHGPRRLGLHPAAPTYEARWRPEWEAAWQRASWSLRQLAREVRGDGARLLAVSIPPRLAVDGAAWADFERDYQAGFGPAPLDRRAPDRRFHELCAQLDVPLLDLVPELEAARAAGEVLHFEGDGHLTPAGHRIVARALEAALREGRPR